MSFQSLAFFGFLAAALAVCLTAGRRSPRAGAAMLAAASAVFYLLGPGGWTVVLGGIACLLAAYRMQRQHFGNFYGSVYSLGAYILLAGVWVLTDSKILLLVSQKAGLVGLITYLSFHALHLPLLQFTIGVLPEKRRMLEILREFVHHITVHERFSAYKKKFYAQEIDVSFHYIGMIQ